MKRNRFLYFLFLFFLLAGALFPPVLLAQTKPLPPIVRKLHEAGRPVMSISHSTRPLIAVKDYPFKDTSWVPQFLVKHKKGVYVCIPGTGRVYQLDIQDDRYSWTRLDSTYFSGYNFGALYFYMDSTLYSFGGEGFWNMSGDLRYYNVMSREWDGIFLSESIPGVFHIGFERMFYFLDSSRKKLQILGANRHPNFVKNHERRAVHKNRLFELDIESGDWREKGLMRDTGFAIWGFLPQGLLVSPGNVVDLENNRYLKPSVSLQRKINSIVFTNPRIKQIDLSYCVDSIFYFGNYEGYMDSLVFSAADLKDTGNRVYTPLEQDSFFSLDKLSAWSLGLFIVAAIFLPWILMRKKNLSVDAAAASTRSLAASNPTTLRSSRRADLLNERELALLAFLFNNSTRSMLTSIEEINGFLGVTNKSIEVQKRMRSDLITSINEKISSMAGKAVPVIDKKRSDFDKRSFEYFINAEYIQLVASLIQGDA
jgi:hypothetical protein